MVSMLMLLIAGPSWSQPVNIKAELDTNSMLIGQQRKLTVTVSAPEKLNVKMPLLTDSVGKLEILTLLKPDTAFQAGLKTISQKLLVTCWDTGFIAIPPIVVQYAQAGDTALIATESEPFLLRVNTVPVDTTKAIREIKPVVELPWTFAELWPYIAAGLILIAAIAGLIYYLKKHKRNVKQEEIIVPPKPAYDIAMQELIRLKEEKLWQNGNYKLYHTRITDILRTYMHRRFGFDAMEMITDEILMQTAIKKLNSTCFSKLQFLLQTADLVKFAKMNPIATENEQCLTNAFDFLAETKPVEDLPVQKQEMK